jgi:ATP-dependent Clp protease ATP-binding subunit ClpB
MTRTNVPLDPNTMGRESLELQANLRKRIVGQEEAIREIVSIYQMYLTGMSAPGRPIGNLLSLAQRGRGKPALWKPLPSHW